MAASFVDTRQKRCIVFKAFYWVIEVWRAIKGPLVVLSNIYLSIFQKAIQQKILQIGKFYIYIHI